MITNDSFSKNHRFYQYTIIIMTVFIFLFLLLPLIEYHKLLYILGFNRFEEIDGKWTFNGTR